MTLAELRALCRLSLADTTDWPNATLDAWIIAGIRLYSAHFPRVWRRELTLITGTQAYAVWDNSIFSLTHDVPGSFDVQAVLSVEYPFGETPPRMCRLVGYGSPEFAAGFGVCALRAYPSSGSIAESIQIVFAETVTTGERAAIEYLAGHALPKAGVDAAVLTVPAHHVEAITSFVEFCALHELEVDEAAALDAATVALSQLGQEARRAWLRYKEVMDRLVWLSTNALQTASVMPAWGDIGL